MEKAAVAMKKSYDVGKHPSQEYSKGDLVWLDTQNLKMAPLRSWTTNMRDPS